MNSVRDVRTLLLCKIKKDFANYYRKIYAPENAVPQTYITLGGFEAINVYQTMPDSDSGRPGWAQKIYNDKVDIIDAMDENVSYHPIHLISYAESAPKFWQTQKEKFPFFVVTFVYGVDSKKDFKTGEDGMPGLDCTTSRHERILANFLRQKSDDVDVYAVYHAMNLSDLVIVWFTSDIAVTLDKITEIEKTGVSRKTYSMVGLPLQNGTIPAYVGDTAKKDPKSLYLRVGGAIRNYAALLNNLEKDNLPDVLRDAERFSTFGEKDFSLICKPTSDAGLVELFQYWLMLTKDWEKACWTVNTDIWIKSLPPEGPFQDAGEIDVALEDMYRKYRRIYKEKLKDFKWSSVFLELLSVYVNIDKNPVLHGPGYLVEDTVQIALSYFCGEVPGYDCGSPSWRKLMDDSQTNIERFARDWGQLTDQVTRIDDVILHGLGALVAIHNTLPEFVMDCYHSLMHSMADLLVCCDAKVGYVNPKEFVYDFFFVPELNQRARISEVFKTSLASCPESEIDKVWPVKQAYIMEFPAPYIFSPKMLFHQLAHECFHCFGDVLRKRKRRANGMAFFLASCFAFEIECNGRDDIELITTLGKHLVVTEEEVGNKFYLTKVVAALEKKMRALVNRNSIRQIYDEAGQPYYLYDERRIEKWIGQEQTYIGSQDNKQVSFRWIIRVCAFLFKECYADAMMVALLEMRPEDYIALFQDEFKNELLKYKDSAKKLDELDQHGNFCKNIQRIAVVLAACCAEGVLTKEGCIQAVSAAFKSEAVVIFEAIVHVFCALYEEDVAMPDTKWFFPAAALAQVRDYLRNTVSALKEEIRAPALAMQVKCFHKTYEDIIVQENLFGKKFYEVIEQRRKN